jgi:hypothetical protein
MKPKVRARINPALPLNNPFLHPGVVASIQAYSRFFPVFPPYQHFPTKYVSFPENNENNAFHPAVFLWYNNL